MSNWRVFISNAGKQGPENFKYGYFPSSVYNANVPTTDKQVYQNSVYLPKNMKIGKPKTMNVNFLQMLNSLYKSTYFKLLSLLSTFHRRSCASKKIDLTT